MRWQTLFEPKRHPEKDLKALTDGLREALGDRLKSLIVFGSWVSGDFDPRRSNVNVLIVTDLAADNLSVMGSPLKPWMKNGHTAPILVGTDELDDFSRDFPIEFLDMQDSHRVVFGQDVLGSLTVNKKHLEAHCEHDLALLQLRLRQAIALSAGNATPLRRILVESLPSALTLLRTALRLEENASKLDKIKAAERLAERWSLDVEVLHRLKELKVHRKNDQLNELAARYLDLISRVLGQLRKR